MASQQIVLLLQSTIVLRGTNGDDWVVLMVERYDAVVVGGGIGGAGIAAALGPHMTVLVLEQEDQPGYHTTGRSAAFYAESYGGPAIQPLTTAAGHFLKKPPAKFGDMPFVTPRGALHIFDEKHRGEADKMLSDLAGVEGVGLVDADAVREQAPDVRWPDLIGAVTDPACGDLEVAALHQAYLKAAKRDGVQLETRRRFLSASSNAGKWIIETDKGPIQADIIINAAGAWGDEVAKSSGVKPVGLKPLRRTAVTIPKLEGSLVHHENPVILNIEETCYFRPEGEGYLISPADETESVPCDAQADEMDIAIALDRFHTYTQLQPRHLTARWAGLRTFAPDRAPVIGADPAAPGFFWSAGQGGWGIQTSPSWSALLADQIIGRQDLIDDLGAIDPESFLPKRFH